MKILAILFIGWASFAIPLKGSVWQDKSGVAVIFASSKAFIQFPIPLGAFVYAEKYTVSADDVTLTQVQFIGQFEPDIQIKRSSSGCLRFSSTHMIPSKSCFKFKQFYDVSLADHIKYEDSSMDDYTHLLSVLGL